MRNDRLFINNTCLVIEQYGKKEKYIKELNALVKMLILSYLIKYDGDGCMNNQGIYKLLITNDTFL